jgi:hypothetical protein
MRLFNNNKGFVSVLSEIKIYLVFVLMVLIFLMLYLLSKNQINNRVKNDFQSNEANLIINNIINQKVEYGGRIISLGELLGYYEANDKQTYWKDQVSFADFIKKTFKDRFEQNFGDSDKWKLIITYSGQSASIGSFEIGGKLQQGSHYTQFIPGYNKDSIIIKFWPPK